MALKKQKKLRKMEIIFTENEMNPICHCEYQIEIFEDGKLLTKSKHRQNMDVADARSIITHAQILQNQNEL